LKGYLWIGTGEGLSRYNGFIIQSFTTADSLAENFVTSGIADGNMLWFGHRNGGITFYNGRNFKKVSCPWRKSAPITHFAINPDGQIWVSTLSNGLFRIEGDVIDTTSRILSDFPVYTFEFLEKDEIIIGTSSGLQYYSPDKAHGDYKIMPVSETGNSRISAIQKMRNSNGFLIATENEGIYKLTIDRPEFVVEKVFDKADIELTSLKNIYEDLFGNLWLASFGNGLIKVDNAEEGYSNITLMNSASGFITDNVQSVFEDREGNIWSGNYGDGLTCISPGLFSVYTFDKNKFGNNIFSICSNGDNLWVGTDKGLIKTNQNAGKVIRFYSTGDGLPNDSVSALYSSDMNTIWIGTNKNGLYCIDIPTDKITRYTISDGALENSVTTITGKGDELWIGTWKGLCNMNTISKELKWYSVSKGGLPHNQINNLYMDKEGNLWVSTNSSILSYINNGKVNKLP
ncbi:MAG: hypothetical protein HZB98_10920, partial [Bacteroidia bacterium]|nr:hypothetical protein [Bacteroidia bacterium]